MSYFERLFTRDANHVEITLIAVPRAKEVRGTARRPCRWHDRRRRMTPAIRYARHVTQRLWLARIMERRPIKVAAVALANKIARIAWALMVRGERFSEPRLLPAAV